MGLAALLAAGLSTVLAAPADERERLAAERRAVDARHAEATQACQQVFFVNDCLDAARNQRRLALDALRQQQLVLDDERRRSRAAERLGMQESRAKGQARAAPASSPDVREARPATAASAAAAETARLPPVAAPATKPASVSGQSARERERQQAFDQRQQAAREHQRAVEERNARQDASRAPAAGLPLPVEPPAVAASR